jgi:hypothetical protein
MKEDAAAKELENLLRDALNTGIESPRGGVPIVQLKTVPLQVQHIPQKKPPTSTKSVPQRVAAPPPSSARAVDQAPDSVPQLADRLEAKSLRPAAEQRKSRASTIAIFLLGLGAIAAAGGAAWRAKNQKDATANQTPVATTTATTVVTTTNATPSSTEGAVGISLTSRPANESSSSAPAAPTPAAETKPAETAAAAPPTTPAPPPTSKVEEPPPPVVKAAATPKAAPPTPEAKPEPTPKKHAAAPPPPAPTPKAEPKPAATPEKKEAKAEPPPKPAPAPANGGVDALLQQQLKGAIP